MKRSLLCGLLISLGQTHDVASTSHLDDAKDAFKKFESKIESITSEDEYNTFLKWYESDESHDLFKTLTHKQASAV